MRLGLVGHDRASACLAGAQSAAAAPAETTITSGPAEGSLISDNTPTFEFAASQANVDVHVLDRRRRRRPEPCRAARRTRPGRCPTAGTRSDVAATNSVPRPTRRPRRASSRRHDAAARRRSPPGPRRARPSTPTRPRSPGSRPRPGSTFACVADGEPLASCDLAFATGATAGRHTFSVAATDAAGNTDPSPATRSFTISLRGAPPSIPRCLYDGNIIVGTNAADTRTGTPGTDLMFGLLGNDRLRGAARARLHLRRRRQRPAVRRRQPGLHLRRPRPRQPRRRGRQRRAARRRRQRPDHRQRGPRPARRRRRQRPPDGRPGARQLHRRRGQRPHHGARHHAVRPAGVGHRQLRGGPLRRRDRRQGRPRRQGLRAGRQALS